MLVKKFPEICQEFVLKFHFVEWDPCNTHHSLGGARYLAVLLLPEDNTNMK